MNKQETKKYPIQLTEWTVLTSSLVADADNISAATFKACRPMI